MSKKRIPANGSKTDQSPLEYSGDVHRFIGISLGGGKSDKACVAVVEFYPKHKKVFLTKIFEKIKSNDGISADAKIFDLVHSYGDGVNYIAFDVPFEMPLCQSCTLKCPGYEDCKEEHIQWMWNYFKQRNKKKKPRKLFTPYTERAIELYLSSEVEEVFHLSHALGANLSPLLSRAKFLARRFNPCIIEVYPKISIWRLGRAFKVQKSYLRFHKHAVGGDESRRAILKSLAEHNVAFVYNQDVNLMIENNHAFESFICALTAFLKFKGWTEDKPKDFPKSETWIDFPIVDIPWEKI